MKNIKLNATKKYNGTAMRGVLMMGICLIFICLVVSCGNANQDDNNGVDSAMDVNDQKADDSALAVNPSDADFVVEAANGGMAEVTSGKIAKEKATNASVKDFATRMVDDHSKINDRLKALASSLNITIPAAIDQKKQDVVDKLNATSVKDFDKTYMDMMVEDHNADVDFFIKASNNISNTDIHNFITEALPILQEHQKMAKKLDDSLK